MPRLANSILFFTLSLVLLGCERAMSRRDVSATNRCNAVLLRVNGRDLTAQWLREKVELAYAKAMAADGRVLARGDGRTFNAYARVNFQQYVADFMILGESLRRQEAIESGDVSNALYRLNLRTLRKCSEIDDFKTAFSNRFEMLKRDFDEQCRLMGYLRRHENFYEVTDEDIDAYYVMYDQDEKRNKVVDDRQWKKSREIMKELKAGLSWTNAVARYSEDHLDNREEFGEDWGTWSLETIPFPEMAERMVSLKVGGYSEPFETDDGLIILKLMDKPEPKRYHLGRILLRLTERTPRPSRNEVRGILFESKYTGAMASAKRELAKSVRFEYPLGTNFVYQIWQETPSKKKAHKPRAATNTVSKTKEVGK